LKPESGVKENSIFQNSRNPAGGKGGEKGVGEKNRCFQKRIAQKKNNVKGKKNKKKLKPVVPQKNFQQSMLAPQKKKKRESLNEGWRQDYRES